jgi:hypothetical protein
LPHTPTPERGEPAYAMKATYTAKSSGLRSVDQMLTQMRTSTQQTTKQSQRRNGDKMATSEIVVYDKIRFSRFRTINLDGMSISEQEKQLDKIVGEINFDVHDFIHICPENKPNMRTFDDFSNELKKATKRVNVSLLTKETCRFWAIRDGITTPFDVPSKGKTMVLPAKSGTCIYIEWSEHKSPIGKRLYKYSNRSV